MMSIIYLFERAPEYDVKKDNSINNKFLIHLHLAKKAGRHFDLRLGYEGVLKSWASKKLDQLIDYQTKKIMLFKQPDHDPSWFDFKGEIEDGYGAGTVQIWDKGTFDVLKWTGESITVKFHGSKIKGNYSLVHYKEDEWLMLKSKE